MLKAIKGIFRALPAEFDTIAASPERTIKVRDPKVNSSEKALGAAVFACDVTAAVSVVVAAVDATLEEVPKSLETAETE